MKKRTENNKSILIIEKQEFWRKLYAKTLSESGFIINTISHYNNLADLETKLDSFDLIIFGCPSIEQSEQQIIAELLKRKTNLLVLCSSLPFEVMRGLFIAGVKDVTEKMYDPEHMRQLVGELFEDMEKISFGNIQKEGFK